MSEKFKFWTEKDFLPLQQHKFEALCNLYAINKEKFTSFYDTEPAQLIKRQDVSQVTIPKYLVKRINLPKFSVSINSESGKLDSLPEGTADDPDAPDIEVSFYATPELVNLIPRIFFAYYLDFYADRAGTGVSLPFLAKFTSNSIQPFGPYVDASFIKVNLIGDIYGQKMLDYKAGPPIDGTDRLYRTEEKFMVDAGSEMTFRRLAPTSFDIGEAGYDSSDIIECKMGFAYNLVPKLTNIPSLRLGKGTLNDAGTGGGKADNSGPPPKKQKDQD